MPLNPVDAAILSGVVTPATPLSTVEADPPIDRMPAPPVHGYDCECFKCWTAKYLWITYGYVPGAKNASG
jgi:hypothetical protein